MALLGPAAVQAGRVRLVVGSVLLVASLAGLAVFFAQARHEKRGFLKPPTRTTTQPR